MNPQLPLQPSLKSKPSVGIASSSPLRKSFSWALIGNAVCALCQWGIIVVTARMGTSASVGAIALALSIVMPVIMLTNLQLRPILAVDPNPAESFGDYFGLRALSNICAFFIILTYLAVTHPAAETVYVIMLFGLARVFDSSSDVVYGLLQSQHLLKRVAISQMTQGALQLLAFAMVLRLSHSIVASATTLAVLSAIVFLTYDSRSIKIAMTTSGLSPSLGLPRFNPTDLKRLLRAGAPMGLVMAGGALLTAIPRIAVGNVLGASQLGIFTAVSYLSIIGAMACQSLGDASIPHIARDARSNNKKSFSKHTRRLILFSLTTGLIALFISIAIGKQLLTLIYGPLYGTHSMQLVLLMASGAIGQLNSAYGIINTALQSFKIQVPIRLTTVALTTIACGFGIRYGLTGIAVALICTGVYSTTCNMLVARATIARLDLAKIHPSSS